MYACPNVESKQGHASAPCVSPPRVAPRPVATGSQHPYATAHPSAPLYSFRKSCTNRHKRTASGTSCSRSVSPLPRKGQLLSCLLHVEDAQSDGPSPSVVITAADRLDHGLFTERYSESEQVGESPRLR